MIPICASDRWYCIPTSGAISTSGSPVSSQCALTLASTRSDSGWAVRSICSSVPSS